MPRDKLPWVNKHCPTIKVHHVVVVVALSTLGASLFLTFARMAPIHVAHNTNVILPSLLLLINALTTNNDKQYDQSIHSASLELKYEKSSHLVDIISKDETLRKMRFDMHKLEDDNEEMRDQLTTEEDRADALEKLANDNLRRAEHAESHAIDLQTDLQAVEQELSILRVCSSDHSRIHFLTQHLHRQKQAPSGMSLPTLKNS
jgi:hypothetical protein